MKVADSVLLSLFMRDNEKCNISHAPSTGLSGIKFSERHSILNIKCTGVIDLQGPEKYNNIEMLSLRHFTTAAKHSQLTFS